MLIPSDFRWIPWELAHRLTIFRFRDVVRTSFVVVSPFSASRALLIHALYNFAGLVLHEHIEKFRRSQGAVTCIFMFTHFFIEQSTVKCL